MLVKLMMFASLRDAFQEQRETILELERAEWNSAGELKACLLTKLQARWLQKNHNSSVPNFEQNSIMLAVNENFIYPDKAINLRQHDVVALIPPVSGG